MEALPLLPITRVERVRGHAPEDSDMSDVPDSDTVAVINMLLLPLVPADYVELPRSSPAAMEVRILNDITDEETELLDEELLALIAEGQE